MTCSKATKALSYRKAKESVAKIKIPPKLHPAEPSGWWWRMLALSFSDVVEVHRRNAEKSYSSFWQFLRLIQTTLVRLFPNMGSLQKVLRKRKRGYYQCFLFLCSLQWDLHTDVLISIPRLLLTSIDSCKRVKQADWNLTNCFAFSLNLSRSGNFHEKSQPTLSTA